MALPPLAQVSDLAAWLGRSIDSADPRAGAVLSQASNRVRAYTHQTWVDDAGALTDVPDVVRDVTVRVAARVWRNPEGLDSITLDDGTKRWGSIRGLAFDDDDLADLSGYVINPRPSGLGILSTYRDERRGSTIYVPTAPSPSGDPFPFFSADDL